MKERLLRLFVFVLLITLLTAFMAIPAYSAPGDDLIGGGTGSIEPNLQVNINGEGSDTVRILVLMTVLMLLPSILIMMTSFVKIIIVFSLLRHAVGIQQTPPNQVLVGLALFLTLFIMRPVIADINQNAYIPYAEGRISSTEFIETASDPLRVFMLGETRIDDLQMFYSISGEEMPANQNEYNMLVVIPSFILSEIRSAFTIGFLLFIPFLIIDMVVSSALMSMGMMMLPPITISLPFKLMLFVLVDGWGLLIRALVSTYT